jgi:SHS family lactate transporter-like MFS transporter
MIIHNLTPQQLLTYQGITVTLMLRSVGALISGTLSDRYVNCRTGFCMHSLLNVFFSRYGRKYLMVANLFLFIVFELASGFCNSLGPFLAVRALYGVCMGVRI